MRHYHPEPVRIVKKSTQIIVSLSFWVFFILSQPLASDADIPIKSTHQPLNHTSTISL